LGVYAKTDDNGGTWGSGDAADNELIQTGETFSDFQYDAYVHSGDNDSIGMVFRWQDASNFYLAVMSRDDMPGTGTGANGTVFGARLYSVVNGSASALDSSTVTYTQG